MYHYTWRARAVNQLLKLHPTIALRIEDKVTNYLTQEPRSNSKALSGKHKGLWRYRVGDYRIFYVIEEVEKTLIITNIDHRSKAYQS